MDDIARKLISGTYEEFSKDTLQVFIKNVSLFDTSYMITFLIYHIFLNSKHTIL